MDSATRSYEVTWWQKGRTPTSGRLSIAGTRAALSGEGSSCTFELGEVRAVVVTPGPAVHVRVRRHGWLIVSLVGSTVAFEVAQLLSGLWLS